MRAAWVKETNMLPRNCWLCFWLDGQTFISVTMGLSLHPILEKPLLILAWKKSLSIATVKATMQRALPEWPPKAGIPMCLNNGRPHLFPIETLGITTIKQNKTNSWVYLGNFSSLYPVTIRREGTVQWLISSLDQNGTLR